VGQEEVVGPLRKILAGGGTTPSLLFWGPPGSGKTTLARLLAAKTGLHFLQFSAVTGWMRGLGYGKGYPYAHVQPDAVVTHGHRPPSVEGHEYYRPTERGYEATIRKTMEDRNRKARPETRNA